MTENKSMQDVYDEVKKIGDKWKHDARRADAIKYLEELWDYHYPMTNTERDTYCYWRAASELVIEDEKYQPIRKAYELLVINMPFIPSETEYRWVFPPKDTNVGCRTYRLDDFEWRKAVPMAIFIGTLDEWYAERHEEYKDAVRWMVS